LRERIKNVSRGRKRTGWVRVRKKKGGFRSGDHGTVKESKTMPLAKGASEGAQKTGAVDDRGR